MAVAIYLVHAAAHMHTHTLTRSHSLTLAHTHTPSVPLLVFRCLDHHVTVTLHLHVVALNPCLFISGY